MNGNAESIGKIKDYLETRIDENVKSASSCSNAQMYIAFMGQRVAFQEILDFVTSLDYVLMKIIFTHAKLIC